MYIYYIELCTICSLTIILFAGYVLNMYQYKYHTWPINFSSPQHKLLVHVHVFHHTHTHIHTSSSHPHFIPPSPGHSPPGLRPHTHTGGQRECNRGDGGTIPAERSYPDHVHGLANGCRDGLFLGEVGGGRVCCWASWWRVWADGGEPGWNYPSGLLDCQTSRYILTEYVGMYVCEHNTHV